MVFWWVCGGNDCSGSCDGVRSKGRGTHRSFIHAGLRGGGGVMFSMFLFQKGKLSKNCIVQQKASQTEI